jgi:hypothetical protein
MKQGSKGREEREDEAMNLLGLYLREFNREYLSTPADRRQVWENVLNFLLTVTLIVNIAVILWAC